MSKETRFGIGCIGLLITLPMWYAIMFGVMKAADAPDWVWLLYWIYVPLGLLIRVLGEYVEKIHGGSGDE